MRFENLIAGAVLLSGLVFSAPAGAQQGDYARMVVIDPKPGQDQAFADGYRRHLRWHEENHDPWSWHGWTFVLGERMGQFMDGTFDHAPDALDRAIKPAEDAADNRQNVNPHADFLSHGVYRRLTRLSTGAKLPDTSAFLVLDTYTVRPGSEARFEAEMEKQEPGADADRSWFRLVIGGRQSQYVLMRRAASWADAVSLAPLPVTEGTVESHESELLRFQRDMSYFPPRIGGGTEAK